MDEEIAKSLLHRPVSLHDAFVERAAREGDWIILAQPARRLPLGLAHLIPLSLKEAGNELFEETRQLNNRHAGCSFRAIEAMAAADAEFLDLTARALAWGEAVADQVSFRLRHRARAAPYRTCLTTYRELLGHIDTVMVHGADRLHQLVWSAVLDLLPYRLLDSILLAPGHVSIVHEQDAGHQPRVVMTDQLQASANLQWLTSLISLYGVEPSIYLDRIILSPLLETLKAAPSLPPSDAQRDAVENMLADLLEASPYLMSSHRAERYMFRIPGTDCMANLSFIAMHGYARFAFFDDEEGMWRGVRTNFARAGLVISHDGQLSTLMHPWRTLNKQFAPDDAVLLTYWLLKQVHDRVVQDYLRIENYYLHTSRTEAHSDAAIPVPDDALLHVAWAKTSGCDGPASAMVQANDDPGDPTYRSGTVPQLRQRHFFKLLGHCGVTVEQGKGSELKLLRKARHPFRLGNHYGSNPTIPAFLAIAILKRLEITRQEWLAAMAAS